MSLRDSPLHNFGVFSHSPYKEWMALTRSYKECISLGSALAGVPKPWIEWVEHVVSRRECRGPTIRKRLPYRLAILWQGITLMQEAKFICDQLENALRQLIYLHCQKHNVSWRTIRASIPKYSQAEERLIKQSNIIIDVDEAVQPSLLLHFTFYQTTELIARNWRSISGACPSIVGFGAAFSGSKKLRDKNYFIEDMNLLRKVRNRIAHSSELFQIHEIQNIFVQCDRWLSPLDLAISARIIAYRKQRPRFLESVIFDKAPL